MSLGIYIPKTDPLSCSETERVVYQVPKTTAVADASLKILFEKHLSFYGKYKSVSIVNGVAKVMLESDMDSTGHYLIFATGCQRQSLFEPVKDTLLQYPSIKSVEFHYPKGKIEF